MSDRRVMQPHSPLLDRVRALGRSKWARNVGRATAIVLVGLSLYYVARSLIPALVELELPDPGEAVAPLGLALLVALACTLLAGAIWRLFLSSASFQIPWLEAIWLQATSNLVKYLPGAPWQLVGRAYLTERRGVPLKVVSSITLLEAACWLTTGIVVALALLPSSVSLPGHLQFALWLRWPVLGLAIGALALIPPLSARWMAYASDHGLSWGAIQVRPLEFWLACLGMVGHWLLMGFAFWLVISALSLEGAVHWGHAASALAASSAVGLVVLLAPGGIGVREAALTYTLGNQLTLATASLVAVASRVLFVLAELVGCLLVVTLRAAIASPGLLGHRSKGRTAIPQKHGIDYTDGRFD